MDAGQLFQLECLFASRFFNSSRKPHGINSLL